MAKTLTHKLTTTETLNIKGILSDDSRTISYFEDGEEKEAIVEEYLKLFAGQTIDLKIATKAEQDLSDNVNENYETAY